MNITNSNHPSTVRPVALALILGVLGAAQAFSAEPASITVKYGDLDLSTPSGAHTLYSRISGAARTVCGYSGTDFIDQALIALYCGSVLFAHPKLAGTIRGLRRSGCLQHTVDVQTSGSGRAVLHHGNIRPCIYGCGGTN